MNNVVVILLIVIVILLWKFHSDLNKKFDRLLQVIEPQEPTTWKSGVMDWLPHIHKRISGIEDSIAQILSIETKEHPAGAEFHAFVREDTLSSIYAGHLERYENLPKQLALKRARFEVTEFGQETVAKKINSDFPNGVRRIREKNHRAEFFSSGIIENDIKKRLEEKIIPYHLFAPLYDLIVKQSYSGEKEFAAEITGYRVETYKEMVERAAIISELERLGVLIRTGGENWGALLQFRLKSRDTDKLKTLIYSGGPTHDDEYFEERFKAGDLPRIFDSFHLGLI